MQEIRIDFSALTRLREQLATAPEVVREELLAAVTEADLLLEREVKDAWPHASGVSRDSIIGVEKVDGLAVEGFVGSSLNYVEPVDLGAKPHFPPVDALIEWVKLRFAVKSDTEARGIAFVVARKIAASGTEGKKVFGPTLARLEPAIAERFRQAQDNIAARLGLGSA